MRVLVIDPEYLVAMEVERILEEAFGCEVEIATPYNYPLVLEKGGFAVIVIDASLLADGQGEAARRIENAAAAIVFTTLDAELEGVPGFEGLAIVQKPLREGQLVRAVGKAIAAN